VSTNGPEERALSVLAEELQNEATPSLPWDSMERELLAKLDKTAAVQPRPRQTLRIRAFATLAAAAAVALVVGLAAQRGEVTREEGVAAGAVRWRPAESIAFLPGSELERDLSTLRVGEGVEAGEAPLVLVRRGAVRVTLEPKARAFVVAAPAGGGEAFVLGLERGALRADVTTRSSREAIVETFAVDVGRTRIAAHGTAFRVIRGESEVVVDLEHGSVAVGLAGRTAVTTGRLLVGRARASFSLDGGQTALMLPTDEPKSLALAVPAPAGLSESNPSNAPLPASSTDHLLPAPSSRQHASLAPPEIAPAVEPSVVVSPEPPKERVLSRASVQSSLASCFERHYGSADPSVRLSVSGKVMVSLDEAGSVSSVRFDPPLEAPFMNCVFSSLKPGRFSEVGAPISVPFSLGR